ncbi:f-box domain-containing [Trichoderma arundinaceum]|uniref:F-box domain-containing n=1 Tax=Trichoderma arundinaceum TaxID=490622 RepID=A0A395N773_TRIAR|nr:f-box domain-containing [Trichoderma arundinaceum]
METIREVDSESEDNPLPEDPDIPPLYYVQSPTDEVYYYRSYKLPVNPGPVSDNPDRRTKATPVFYFDASQPLPELFCIPFRDSPPAFYVSLTHDDSRVNLFASGTFKFNPHTAMQRVFRTPELLESIFLKLDMVTLLTSVQRVSKMCKRVIDGSIALQRKLYFRPDPNAELGLHPQAKWTKDSRKVFPVLNTLLLRYFSSCFFNFGGVYGWLRRAESFYENRWTRHRHRLKRVDTLFGRHTVYKSMPPDPELNETEKLEAAQDRDRFTRAGASWRKMMVSQPPIPDFGVLMFKPVQRREPLPQKMERAIIGSNHPDGGLRMGQLYDFVQDRAGNHPLDSLWFRLTWFEAHGPFTSDLCEDSADMMYRETQCIVEMFHKDDADPLFHPRDPERPVEFDDVFKCDDFQPHKWKADMHELDHNDPGYNRAGPLVERDACVIWCGFAGK